MMRVLTSSISRHRRAAKRYSSTYAHAYRQSIEQPREFWRPIAEQIDWHREPNAILDDSVKHHPKWFPGGQLNMCHNAVDRHVLNGKGDECALIYDSSVLKTVVKYSYGDMLNKVQRIAGMLRHLGVKKGDRVLIYMPMIPETMMTMLACARIGATHVVVFGGFAAKELSVRIDHTTPHVIVTASEGIEPSRVIPYKPIVDEAINLSKHQPHSTILLDRGVESSTPLPMTAGRDHFWSSLMRSTSPITECTPVDVDHPLYILHTSGTTGTPKGIVRPTGGYAVVLPWSMNALFGVRPGERWWAASDFGWVVGHSYICYAPLLAGLTSVLHEGKPVGTPDAGEFFRIISQHNITNFFTAPTALRAIRQHDPDGHFAKQYDLTNLRCCHPAGEHLDMETRKWAEKTFGVPVLDHWWQTESGWPISHQCIGYEDANMSPPKDCTGRAVPGWNIQIKHDKADGDADLARIVVELPLPPGALSTFWPEDDERFRNAYFDTYPGNYDSCDAGYMTDEGQVQIMSRVDDVINVAGHRLSTGALEEAVLGHHSVVDCAVVGMNDKLKGTMPVAFIVLSDDHVHDASKPIVKQIEMHVRTEIGAVASLRTVFLVDKLPKTRSGKTARNTLQAIVNGKTYVMPVTIDDPTVYPSIEKTVAEFLSK